MVSTTTDEWERSLGEWTRGFEDGAALGEARIAAEGRMGMGYCTLSLGRIEAAAEALDDAIARAAPVDAFMQALAMCVKGMLLFATGEREAGVALVLAARRIQERIGDHEGGGVAQSFLAQMTFAQGDPGRALALYGEALAMFETVGDLPEVARVHCEMGWTALAASDPRRATESFRRALRTGPSSLTPTLTEARSPTGPPQPSTMGVLIAMAGDPERGVLLASRAMALNPHHPGWYHVPLVFDHVRRRDYGQGLQATKRINMPGFFFPDYREELERYRELWIRDAAVWDELVEGLAEAEALAWLRRLGPPPG